MYIPFCWIHHCHMCSFFNKLTSLVSHAVSLITLVCLTKEHSLPTCHTNKNFQQSLCTPNTNITISFYLNIYVPMLYWIKKVFKTRPIMYLISRRLKCDWKGSCCLMLYSYLKQRYHTVCIVIYWTSAIGHTDRWNV